MFLVIYIDITTCVFQLKKNMSDQYVKKMEKSSLDISFKELTMNENNHVY